MVTDGAAIGIAGSPILGGISAITTTGPGSAINHIQSHSFAMLEGHRRALSRLSSDFYQVA